jgi:hypothetical protein
MHDNAVTRPLITLCGERGVKALSLFSETCRKLTQEDLASWYHTEMTNAPDRWAVGKRYLIDSHQGIPGTGDFTNRDEEHLALAIFNQYRSPNSRLKLPNGEELRMLEYQLPLKAKQNDAGVGKVDLFAITLSGRACVIELKAARGGDTPLKALLEGLAYAAIIQANIASIHKEVQARYHLEINSDFPAVIIMAPEEYWSRFRANPAAGRWESSLQDLGYRIQNGIGVSVSFITLSSAAFTYGLKGTCPSSESAITCGFALRASS